MNLKKAIRKEVRERIAQMTEAEILSQSLCICRQVEAMAEWKQATDVLLYAALSDEVSLSALISDAMAQGKTVWLPVVDGEKMRIRQYIRGKTSVSGAYRIEEPTAEAPELHPCEYSKISLAVVPGRAFTPDGARLGRGKGYYDRFLSLYHGLTIGVGFACQLYASLPADEWDRGLDKIVVPV